MVEITQAEVRRLFDYDDKRLYWRIWPRNQIQIGDKVGNLNQNGCNDCLKHLGFFSTEVEAACVYDKMAAEAFGEFAKTNETLGKYVKRKDAKEVVAWTK